MDERVETGPGDGPLDGAGITDDGLALTALPSALARGLAFAAVVVSGLFGGLIGYAVVEISDGSAALAVIGAAIGAAICAVGVGVVAVLVLRAMAEWNETAAVTPEGRRR